MKLSRDEQLVQDALNKALTTVRDHVSDPRLRSKLYDKTEEIVLIHKGSLRDR